MADQTITETVLAGGQISYELGRANWESRRIPNIRQPGSTVQIPEGRLIDVVILGDGFTAADEFRAALVDWLADFYALAVYDLFAGAFRIRAVYTPSTRRASTNRDSYYRCGVNDAETALSEDGDWWLSPYADGVEFRRRLWGAVDSFADANLRRYSNQLNLDDNIAVGNRLRDLYRNLIVSMLVCTSASLNVSGMTRDIPRESPDQARRVRVAFGANKIHEFSHAFGLLSDEYIDGRGTRSAKVNPAVPSVWTMSNLTYADRDDTVPWLHLAPSGRFRRTASGGDPSPLAGWLWVGGVKHTNVWHSEYRCLMNGKHDNFAFTQVAANDPTPIDGGAYTDEHGAALRDDGRFCLWCQEVVTIRILEKTDQLMEPGDPSDPTVLGQRWHTRWVGELREKYYRLLAVDQQILDAEVRYAATNPGRNGEPLWQSDLYRIPRASSNQASRPVPTLADDEFHLLLGYTAIP